MLNARLSTTVFLFSVRLPFSLSRPHFGFSRVFLTLFYKDTSALWSLEPLILATVKKNCRTGSKNKFFIQNRMLSCLFTCFVMKTSYELEKG